MDKSTVFLLREHGSFERLLLVQEVNSGVDGHELWLGLERYVLDRDQVDLHWIELLSVKVAQHSLLTEDMNV